MTASRTPPDYLAKLNSHERDPYIEFDEGPHIYTVRGEGGYTSVTTWNHSHFSHFDADGIIDRMLKGKNASNPSYKYYGMSREDIKAAWDKNRDEAASAGTQLHYDIECYWNRIPLSNTSVEYGYFLNFVRDFPELKPYRTEWMIYYEELKLSGSVDMVFEKPDGTLLIYDWKRCKEISYDDRRCAITDCIRHLPDTNFWHYSLQLNTYKTILEKKYGKTVTGLYLVCMHPENPYRNYERIEVPSLEKEMVDLFEYRREQLLSEHSK
jgi:hypothetical protein